MNRPGMVALLEYLDAHPENAYVVIFDDLKRFARDTMFHLMLRQELAAYGATVACLNFKFEDKCATPARLLQHSIEPVTVGAFHWG